MTRRTPAQYNWAKLEFDEELLTKHFTPMNSKKVEYVVVHHMTILGKGTGAALDAAYKTWQSREASANYGVDGKLVRQFVWDKDYAWAQGSTEGNLHGISIEHANSTAAPKWLVADDTWKTGAKLAAYLHKVYKLGRPVSGRTLRKHSSFISTACPGPYLGGTIWAKYVAEAQRVYDEITSTKPTPPTPAPAFVEWFDGMGWNLAASDKVHGEASWDKRMPKIVDALKTYDRDVYHLVEFETAGVQGKAAAAALKKAGYKIAVGNNQRAITVRADVKVGRTKVITLKERGPANDDKQMVLAEIWPEAGGNAVIAEAGHLEFRDGAAYDKVRVAQAKQVKAETLAFAQECAVPESRIVFYNDENSASQVSTKAFGPSWQDLGSRVSYVRAVLSTLISWAGKTTSSGYRPDKVRVYRTRPAKAITSIAHVGDDLSDHLPVAYTFGKI